MTAAAPPTSIDDPSENEAVEMARLGISRTTIYYFEFGGYRYSSLKDAVAQALRSGAPPMSLHNWLGRHEANLKTSH